MDPLVQPVNVQPQTVAGGSPPATAPIPGLTPISELDRFVKPTTGLSDSPTKGVGRLRRIDEVEKLLVPVAAVGGAVLQPEGFVGKKALTFLTGFKAGEAGSAVNKLTPGALLFLAPEPIGFLPERFLMDKPHIPWTKIYLDPFYNFTLYERRKDRELRSDVGGVQIKLLGELLPSLSTEQVRTLYLDTDLRQRSLTFISPQYLDQVLRSELDRRRRIADQAAVGQLIGVPQTDIFQVEDALAGSFHPELVQPVNDAALRNQADAEGIRRVLVHERADP